MNIRSRKRIKRRKQLKKIHDIFEATYLLTFFICAFGIAGNIELDRPTPVYCWIIFAISGFLTVGKLIYCSIKYPDAKYYWFDMDRKEDEDDK